MQDACAYVPDSCDAGLASQALGLDDKALLTAGCHKVDAEVT